MPLKEAGTKVSIFDLLGQWFELVEYAKKTLFLARFSYLVTCQKSLRHPDVKVRATCY